MTTINDAVFMSDDEEDESFNESDISSEEDNSKKNNVKYERDDNNEMMDDLDKEERIEILYDDILKKSMNIFSRQSTVNSDDFMLQFQRKCYNPPNFRKNSNISELMHYIDIGTSKVLPKSLDLDIMSYKNNCRDIKNISSDETHELVRSALSNAIDKNPIYIEKQVRYAGKSFKIREKVEKLSYNKHKKGNQFIENALSGKLSVLDDIVSKITKESSINSIQKSHSDWSEFKQMTGIESQLEQQRKYGYLSKTAFLQRADWRQHEIELEAKRRALNNHNKQ
ncbi:uncharacterized protein CMU_018800 [Cryptosporidium muris RN66]|uniref:BCNT-C domain-containing protein n=1 Tax=Cryptosporidium muris (strain RN66) TaxID=441375 RepID=B6AC67_CRYMR|nr:uncharacterized protein CMU_018800 [Cryptosporidium muris RN66]EEA06123.1 hypothetical protein, conserved [Cryptosporidium muris RN66]|eukprot:XP_002140472.1 hypothetical protein [Cryptosporidium muris RN66]